MTIPLAFKNKQNILTCFFLVIPLFSILDWGTVYYLGAVFLFFQKGQDTKLYTIDKVFLTAMCLCFIVPILSMLCNHFWEWRYIDKYSRFLAGALVYWALVRNQKLTINTSWLKLGFYSASFIGFLYASYQKLFLGIHLANAAIFSISFGEIMTFVAAICLLQLGKGRLEKWTWRTLFFIFAFAASLMAGTKGAWVAYPLLLAIVIHYQLNKSLRIKAYTALITILILVFSLIPFTRQRIQSAYQDVTLFFTEDKYHFTSQGARLLMWNFALEAYTEKPICGLGPGRVNDAILAKSLASTDSSIQTQMQAGKEYIVHAHNDWIETLAGLGILGFISFAIFALYPVYINIKYRKKATSSIRMWSSFSLITCCGFAIFMLTQCLHSTPREVWIAFNILSFSQLRNSLISQQKILKQKRI